MSTINVTVENITLLSSSTVPTTQDILAGNYSLNFNSSRGLNSTESPESPVPRLGDTGVIIVASLWVFLATIGFLGNAFLFVMTHNQSIHDQSYACYLSALSVVDSVVLFVRLVHGSALLASPHAREYGGPLVGVVDTSLACVLLGVELCARCVSAWLLGD